MKRKLTDTAIKKAKPKPDGKPNNLFDGGGLFLQVKPGGKYWRYDYRRDGKRGSLYIGDYQDIGLELARERHREARELLARGVDPSSHKKALKSLKADLISNSFEAIAREYHNKYLPTWQPSYAAKMLGYLEKDVFPWIGSKPITEIEAPEIVKVICRQDERGAGGAARKVKQHIQQVYDYAIAVGMVSRNPARDVKTSLVLKPRQVRHFASLKEPGKVGGLMRSIYGYEGQFTTCCALKLAALVMLRPSELIHAQWSEIDLDNALWTIPIKRMKARTHVKEANLSSHYVPLSRQAVEILQDLFPLTGAGKGGYLFPSVRTRSNPMSNNTVNAALRRLGYVTVHGLATARV
ncbi:MAG: integrase arm-type DNA-binding domain-containing protein [Thiothrix litoralis]|uniref:tyrosine-type recombinase/integrase n=1 Tax=Thiothrix litoralis TaxID=2891210 RepID=UPI003C758A5C